MGRRRTREARVKGLALESGDEQEDAYSKKWYA
jgi:hypothetical protein